MALFGPPGRGGSAALNVTDLRAYLAGTWNLARTISDTRLGQRGTMTGQAVFRNDGDDLLRYREDGRLAFGGYQDDAAREYLYRFAEPAVAFVCFVDGRPFHELDLRAGEAAVRHLCSDDIYDGVIQAESEQSWRAHWSVSGPRKNLSIESRYTRQP